MKRSELIAHEDPTWKIREKRWLWNLMPFAGRNKFTTTWGETTYLTPRNYSIWDAGRCPSWLKDLLRHEYVHVLFWRRDRRYNVRYVFSRTYRRHVECNAYAEQCRHAPMTFRHSRAAKYAEWLCSARYCWTGGRGNEAEIARRIMSMADQLNTPPPGHIRVLAKRDLKRGMMVGPDDVEEAQ